VSVAAVEVAAPVAFATKDEAYEALAEAKRSRFRTLDPVERATIDLEIARVRAEIQRLDRIDNEQRAEYDRSLREERRAYAAARPERWRALSHLARCLFAVAAENPRTVRGALIKLAEMIGNPARHSLREPATTFEQSDQ